MTGLRCATIENASVSRVAPNRPGQPVIISKLVSRASRNSSVTRNAARPNLYIAATGPSLRCGSRETVRARSVPA
jgi:hypothetical protein